MRNIKFVNGQFYHIYNRGVLKNNIFLDNSDYVRFIHYLYAFNSVTPIPHIDRVLKDVRGPASDIIKIVRGEPLVDIASWCLMQNHFHLILRQRIDNGIRRFMHKVETGHAMSFNKKYNRSGVLYEGRFKAILIEMDEYLSHLFRYIHLNPVDLIESGWKEKGIEDWDRVNKFLENYRWSSYPDYIGKKNFPSILNKEAFGWYFKSPEEHKKFIQSWVSEDMYTIEELILE